MVLVGLCGGLFWLFVHLPLYGDVSTVRITLRNATGVPLTVSENVPFSPRVVADLDPGQTAVVWWDYRDKPTYRATSSNGQTLYCGPFGPGGFLPDLSWDRSPALDVVLTRQASIRLDRVNGVVICQPPA